MTKQDLKIIFFGTPDFAVESLRAIVDHGYNVAAVVTATDKIGGRGHRVIASAVKTFAIERGIPVLQPEKLRDSGFIDTLRSINADLFVVIAFRMMPEVVWSMPRLGTFNLHASLLPKYRGAAPINWAVINGETRTGVTTFFLSHEIDTGDVIDRVAIDIAPDDNVGVVHDRLMELGASLTIKTIDSIVDGTLTTTSQDRLIEEGDTTCPAPKIFTETCHIDWNRPAVEIHNLVRGLSPYPCSWSTLLSNASATDVKILRTAITDIPAETPGSVRIEDNRFLVSAADRFIEILELKPSGKKAMDGASYLRGARLSEARFK